MLRLLSHHFSHSGAQERAASIRLNRIMHAPVSSDHYKKGDPSAPLSFFFHLCFPSSVSSAFSSSSSSSFFLPLSLSLPSTSTSLSLSRTFPPSADYPPPSLSRLGLAYYINEHSKAQQQPQPHTSHLTPRLNPHHVFRFTTLDDLYREQQQQGCFSLKSQEASCCLCTFFNMWRL